MDEKKEEEGLIYALKQRRGVVAANTIGKAPGD